VTPVSATRPAPAKEEEKLPRLPAMEELVAKIPASTQELMDQLFRARFVTVKRVPVESLKN